MSFLQGLFGGSKSKQQSGLDPRFANLFFGNYNTSNEIANNLGARQMAGMNTDWQSGADLTRNNAMSGPGFGSLGTAASALSAGTGFQPTQIGAPSPVTANTFLTGNVGAYMDPYQKQVADRTMQGLERQRQIAQVNDASRMTAAKAFGNDRRGIVDAQTNEAYDRNAADALAGLYSNGFSQASNLMQADQNRMLSADQFNVQQSLMAQQSNQNAGLQGQQLANSAAQGLANVGQMQQGAGFDAANAMMGIGQQQQQLDQAQLDAYRNLDQERMAIRNQALGINVGGGSGMTSSGSSSSSAGALNSISNLFFGGRGIRG
jgi:hypothetical protein